MSKKIIQRIGRLVGFGFLIGLFYLSDTLYKTFLFINLFIEEIQRKKGHKDPGEKKYGKEELIMMSMMIPEGTRLTMPEVKKFYKELSKEHIYKLIEFRRKINENKDGFLKQKFFLILREIFPDEYA